MIGLGSSRVTIKKGGVGQHLLLHEHINLNATLLTRSCCVETYHSHAINFGNPRKKCHQFGSQNIE
jgi:hypothetical protein